MARGGKGGGHFQGLFFSAAQSREWLPYFSLYCLDAFLFCGPVICTVKELVYYEYFTPIDYLVCFTPVFE